MQKSKDLNRMARMAILIAITLMLGLTILGYPKIGPVDMTIVSVPVIVGAMLMGPGAGALLGGVFGLTSFLSAVGFGLGSQSPFGAALLSINVLFTLIVCFVPRILMGWLDGLLFRWLAKKDSKKTFCFIATSLGGALMNTVFFMALLLLLFGQTEYIQNMQAGRNIIAFVLWFVGINALVEAVAVTLLGTAVGKALYTMDLKKR